ncbi:hypothetical protein [Haloarchaeobius sp. TZWSO28]|uniref:hypothetical protein n=1 Tax=Haloarchaeobius sp. TZWSO28 TaxID=3446119 RepID=UPI003EB97F7C
MALEYRQTTDPCGIEVLDPIAQVSLELSTSTNQLFPGPEDLPFSEFVADTFEVETTYVDINHGVFLPFYDEEMNFIQWFVEHQQGSLPFGTYIVNTTAVIKCYLLFTGAPTVTVSPDRARIEFDEARRVVLGCRSEHSNPATTIQTTGKPSDVASAISALSSGSTMLSPDRSWPGVRRHPPRIEHGDDLVIPETLSQPDGSIELVVPPHYGPLYTAAPLAYYLSGTVRVGDTPGIMAGDEWLPLGRERALEEDLVRAQKRLFFLDCLARSVGVYKHKLPAREEILSSIPYDLEWAYDAAIEDRVRAYFDVSYEDIEPELPRFPLVAHLPPSLESLESIPHILHRFGIIRAARARPTTFQQSTVEAFVRRTSAAQTRRDQTEDTYVEVELHEDAVNHAWFGPGLPTNAAKGFQASFENAIDGKREKDTLDVLVVCNDSSMLPEHEVLDEFYDKGRGIQRNVSLRSAVSRDELSASLEEPQYDLFHFIGHATKNGLECPDGHLDVGEVASVGVDLFVLNACETYEQAKALVTAGAVAGVATSVRVANDDAMTVGRNVSRLLSDGFSMSGAVEQATMELGSSSQYLVLGDGLSRYCTSTSSVPNVVRLTSREDGQYDFWVETYLRGLHRFGQSASNVVNTPEGDDVEWEAVVLDPGVTPKYALPAERLPEVVMGFGSGDRGPPVRMNGRLHWPNSEAAVEQLLDR